jgi:uncharacterized protein YndB with AHSA1/START domain
MNNNLQLEVFYPHPPEMVWKALTDSTALSKWLMPANFEPRVGFRFSFGSEEAARLRRIEGVVLEADAPKILRYTWQDEGEDGEAGASVVSWTLKPKDGGTELTLEHQAAPRADVYAPIEASSNWPELLAGSLPAMLSLFDTRPRVPVVYVAEDPHSEPKPTLARAGFRQEEAN